LFDGKYCEDSGQIAEIGGDIYCDQVGSAVAIIQDTTGLTADYRIALSNVGIYVENCEYTTDYSQSQFVASNELVISSLVDAPYTITFPSFILSSDSDASCGAVT
jgi:hypothetical protein